MVGIEEDVGSGGMFHVFGRDTNANKDGLPLLKVVLDPLGLSKQEWDVDFGRLDEFCEGLHRDVEFLFELRLLLVTPGLRQRAHSGLERLHAPLEVIVESFEVLGESSQFGWIGNGLGHEKAP